MAELLLELLSEEIPARMQARAADDMRQLVTEGLEQAGLTLGEAQSFATPRRLALVIDGVAAMSAEVREEKKGPRVGAPEAAIQGFLKGAGLASLAEAVTVSDAKKGDYYVAALVHPGRKAAVIIAEVVAETVANFPWPKSMRWGAGKLRWVRPLQSIVCLLDGKVVPIEIDGIKSGTTTRGHRFLGAQKISVSGFEDYRAKLAAEHVILDPAQRAKVIADEAARVAAKHGLKLISDDGLVVENAGLTEWPVVLAGKFDAEFLKVPAGVLRTSMRAHQKCFSVVEQKSGKLANTFLMVANLTSSDGGTAIIAGNEKVIRARLADAKFFYEQDLKRPLDEMWSTLRSITFHDKLGSQWDRVERIAALAEDIAPRVDAPEDEVRRAAQLCKADLVSGVVGEFPELQGVMGRTYAEAIHMLPSIARAIEEHYWPRGQGDQVPKEPVSIAVALADRLDQLVGFWAIDEKPTGSKDPYALRRAALGVIRIILENDLRLPLGKICDDARSILEKQGFWPSPSGNKLSDQELRAEQRRVWSRRAGLEEFFADRLKVHLREQGARHDLIDAVFSLGNQDDLALIVHRVNALGAFLKTDDGATLLAGTKRAANILAIEEKKDKQSHAGAADASLLKESQEKTLYAAIQKVTSDIGKALDVENFQGAMRALAELRAPVDAFFDKVTVNADESKLRQNRLKLLSEIRAATEKVADFSKIAG